MREEAPIANYGYSDATGDYYLTVYGGRCTGCGECVEVCPHEILEIYEDDWGQVLVRVKGEQTRHIGYICRACKARSHPQPPPCVQTCQAEALAHSW
ncbi:MAG TPA: 4Fe-4S binding protein [Dehalococcoidia bacterium]|jgi:Fe-S-cluster-containing hydrogenase component 2|nr:4Fe-4S binding protein [Dehalococcoidia bacterium]